MTDANSVLGHVEKLYRFPVKSLLGESQQHLEIGIRGVESDRLFAVTDQAGKFGSHKSTRRFAKLPGLFSMRAYLRGDEARIVFPDGADMAVGEAATDARVSDIVGQPVTVATEQAVSHFDAAAIHVISTASLGWLQSMLPGATIDPLRFRANVVVACDGEDPVESSWIGKTLSLGSVQLEVIANTERCVMTTLAQGDLPNEPDILTTIGRQLGLNFGVYATVSRPGVVAVGDTVHVGD
ncbi:MAG: MOSC domain-containing protein [Pseudomonadota bacterium]